MSIIYTETKSATDSRTDIDVGDHRTLAVNITGEGIIIDLYLSPRTDESDLTGFDKPMHLGTVGMTFEEWANWITESKGQFNKDSRTERWTIVDDSVYVVAHIGLVDGEQLYWSNEDGWGSIQTATRWPKNDTWTANAPIGGVWTPEATAIKDPNNTDPWD